MEARSGMRFVSVVSALLLVTACQQAAGPSGVKPRSLSLSVVASAADSTASAIPLASADSGQVMTLSDSTNTLVLDSVQIIVRRIEMTQADTTCSANDGDADDQGDTLRERQGEWGDNDECAELKVGPVLVNVPLDGNVKEVFAAQLPAGTYSHAELQIHSPMPGDSADAAFLAGDPGFDSVSVRVVGTFDDSAFTYTHRIEARQSYTLDPPMVVSPDSGASNLTLSVDVGSWFVRRDGSLINPATAMSEGTADYVVAWNIMRSLWAFKDDNRDGRCDRR